MSALIFGNNAQSTILNTLTTTTAFVDLALGTGALFPQPGANQYFVATFTDAETGLINEIVHVTAMVGDRATIVRGQEGTSRKTWEPNDSFAELWTAGQAGLMLQKGDEQSGASTYGVATGTGNNITVALTPPLTFYTEGQTLRFKAIANNTGATQIRFGTPAAVSLRNSHGDPLSGGEIIAGYIYECFWTGSVFNMAVPSLVPIPVGMIAPYAGGVVPAGWLACNGASVAAATYAALFAVIGTTYGGTGAPNFNLPDLRGRTPFGLDGGSGRVRSAWITNPNSLGGNGGVDGYAFSVAQMPTHTHPNTVALSAGTHTHGFRTPFGTVVNALGPTGDPSEQMGQYAGFGSFLASLTEQAAGSGDTVGITNQPQGNSAEHSNMPPALMVQYMIKT